MKEKKTFAAFDMDLDKVKLLALDNGWSIIEVARMAGISPATIYQATHRYTTATTLQKIAGVLGVKPSDLIAQRVAEDETEA